MMLGPLKVAASSTRSVVASSTSASIGAEDAGDDQGALGVGDDQVVGAQGAVDAVEGDDVLAGAGAARDQPAAADLGGVEGVQRLAHGQHHVVGDVDHVVDGAHAGVREARLEPGRRLAHRDAADDAGAVARRTGRGRRSRRRSPRRPERRSTGRLGDGRRRQRQPGRRRHLAGDAVDRLRQSGRLGVTSISSTASATGR